MLSGTRIDEFQDNGQCGPTYSIAPATFQVNSFWISTVRLEPRHGLVSKFVSRLAKPLRHALIQRRWRFPGPPLSGGIIA